MRRIYRKDNHGKKFGIVEAAMLLEIKARTVREWIRNGKVKAEKTSSGKWMIMESEIEKIIENKCNKIK